MINIIIQARMGSTRLPGKILKPIMGRPLLSYLLERVHQVTTPHQLIIATTIDPQSDPIEKLAKEEKILFFRGSEENVLDRYYQTSLLYPAEIIVRLTSDCPLIDPAIIDQALASFQNLNKSVDYLSNTLKRTFPRGMDIEVFTFDALKAAAEGSRTDYEKEHVTPYIYKHPERFRLINFSQKTDTSQYRLTVDTAEDFLLIRSIIEKLYPKNHKFTLNDILLALDQHPEWLAINSHIKQREA